MGHPYVICDVFTETALEGNQLAVFTDATGLTDERRLQRLARELNLSETVFAYPPTDRATADARIRIFTPTAELPFAGHPVLGAACVLAERLRRTTVRLETAAGVVPVEVENPHEDVRSGWMVQPMPASALFPAPEQMLAALGVSGSRLPLEAYDNGSCHAFVALETPEEVAAVRPDFNQLAEVMQTTGVSCFAPVGTGRYVTRMFVPGAGINEDPATGSAAGPLALHLVRHGELALDTEIAIEQGAQVQRPSLLRARIEGRDGAVARMHVGGSAVIVGEGMFRLA